MSTAHSRPAGRLGTFSLVLAAATLCLPPLALPAQAQTNAASLSQNAFQGLRYRSVGPSRGGRVTAVAGHRDHPFTFYMGATGGGVWKTDDYGTTWRPISDGYFNTGSIGSIRVAPSNSKIVYVGTGSDGIRSNVILGRGAYRSDDAGATWRHIGLEKMGQIGALEIHPTNPDVVLAAALGNPWAKSRDRGIYKTTDDIVWVNNETLFRSTDDGATWQAVSTPHGDNHDMWINPDNPDIIVQSNDGGANVSLDGGRTWSTQYNQPTAELYQVDIDDQYPTWLYAGQQDNTTIGIPTNPPSLSIPGGHTALWSLLGPHRA